DAIIRLSMLLKDHTPIRVLDLSKPSLRAECAFACDKLCAGLRCNTTLEVLVMSSFGLDDDGFDAILSACPNTLTHLNISGNRLSFSAAEAIARQIRRDSLPRLRTLVLDGIRVKNQGINALAPVLLKHKPVDADGKKTQLRLSLRRCTLGGQGLTTLALLCKHNTAITGLAVEGSHLVPESIGDQHWDPQTTWEQTLKDRNSFDEALQCDFGLSRNSAGDLKLFFADYPDFSEPK
ncbi:hypothetical protein KIPB_006608, partial [Kipferlia bialata]